MKIMEIFSILLVIIVLAFSLSFANLSLESFLYSALFMAIILSVNVFAKKITAYLFQSEAEVRIWSMQRWGYYERSYLKTPVPIGLLLPFFLTILSLGYFTWLASMQTEVTATKARVAKRHSIYRYTEITDWDLGWISASGIIACHILAILSYLLGFSELSRLAVLFAAFNMIPISKLDGTKIFFANTIVLWCVLAVISLIGLGYVFFLV